MNKFSKRHIGPDSKEKLAMLDKVGVKSIDELVDRTIPSHIRLSNSLAVSKALTEQEYLNHINELGKK